MPLTSKTPAGNDLSGASRDMLAGLSPPLTTVEAHQAQSLILPPMIALHIGGEAMATIAFGGQSSC